MNDSAEAPTKDELATALTDAVAFQHGPEHACEVVADFAASVRAEALADVETLSAPLIAAFKEAVYHEITMSGVCGQSVMEDAEIAVYALRVALGLEVPSRIVGGQDPVTRV